MKYSNLEKSPEFVEKTINLIESSFEYVEPHSFSVDFYPLIKKSNQKNCHILIDNNQVVAHIGALTKQIKVANSLFEFTMFGGIAVSSTYRGQGLFKKLFTEVLKHYNNQAFYLLWSEKTDLYEKFNFYPCGQLNQYESSSKDSSYIFSSFRDLSQSDQEIISSLYKSTDELRPHRSKTDWHDLKKMTSIDLYLKRDDFGKTENYFLKNKGADLTGIIHEYGILDEKISSYGKFWTPQTLPTTPVHLNAFLLRTGEVFKEFLKEHTQIELLNIGTKAEFKFNDENFEMPTSEFLPGVFGPGRFQELNSPFLFIPGITSI